MFFFNFLQICDLIFLFRNSKKKYINLKIVFTLLKFLSTKSHSIDAKHLENCTALDHNTNKEEDALTAESRV